MEMAFAFIRWPVPGAKIAERGVRMVGSELNPTLRKRGEKNEGRVGSLSRFFFSSSIFGPHSTIWTPGRGYSYGG